MLSFGVEGVSGSVRFRLFDGIGFGAGLVQFRLRGFNSVGIVCG